MISYIIICRNPASQKLSVIVDDENGDIAEFATEDEAYECAKTLAMCRAWGAEIVPLAGLDGVL